jgi:Family of unknown function (DUF6424)
MVTKPIAKKAAAKKASGPGTLHEDYPWTMNLTDHQSRTESKEFRAAKALAQKIVATLGNDKFYGDATTGDGIQMHHGGSLWLFDTDGWFMVQNEAGIEWSAQFCSDPAKVDHLRINAKRLYAAFPSTIAEMVRLGYKKAQAILDARIATQDDVQRWVDSIFNSCVPLPASRHIGAMPKGEGRHHYPTPVTDIDLVRYDDFVLWVVDGEGFPAAVVPVAQRGRNVNKTRLAWATPYSKLDLRHARAHNRGKAVEFGASSPITHQAFLHQ